MDFTITAHVEFTDKAGVIKTSTIRMEVPADNGQEAREKAQAFIQRKTTVVIDKCEYKQPRKSFVEELADIGYIFKNWPIKGQGREE